ncbi:MAG TPA: sigma-54-dependent Fis family transcriptional regulator [Planctomycetes bacterium]|nr:sigma-54-dependent Fis family transcriptional regulator [Planctomycetota bacterium]
MLIRVTLAIHDSALRQRLLRRLARPDILVEVPRERKSLWERIVREPADVVIISRSLLPNPLADKMKQLQNHPDSPSVVVLSDSTDPKEHARLIAMGCDTLLFVGLAVDQVRDVIETLLEKRRRMTQKSFFVPQPLAEPRLADFVSESPGMATFMNTVPRVVRSDTTVLIEGETGVGKERLARAIHAEGPRSQGRFVALNCGALPESLMESELFGHVRGAFTGATAARRGWFEVAHRGTLFLDEVGEIPIHIQVKLLRVLQEHEIQPVGSEKSFGVDVRVIAASNRPLEIEVKAGRFRRDLFHRLNVVTITVPPLRVRAEDIPALIEKQIQYLAQATGKRVTGAAEAAMQALCRYPWPGNVREMNNVIERAILLCDDTEITLDDLPESIANSAAASPGAGPAPDSAPCIRLPEQWLAKPLRRVRAAFLSEMERQYVEGLLRATGGRVGRAATRAGIHARSLYEKMKQFGLHKEDFRRAGARET